MTDAAPKTHSDWPRARRAAALGALLGALLWITPLGKPLEHLSYDLPFRLVPNRPAPGIVIVSMDELSMRDLDQEPKAWDRQLHAGLLEHLTRDGAKLVVFDVALTDPGNPDADTALANAMKQHGNVLLAATIVREDRPGMRSVTVKRPREIFLDAARAWGVAGTLPGEDNHAREIHTGDDQRPSLPWQAAHMAGAALDRQAGPFWLNYYGPPGTIRSVSYSLATNQPPGFFSDQIVFLGSRPSVHYLTDAPDQFRTPYTGTRSPDNPGGQVGPSPGVEVMATATLNLLRHEWLTRWSRPAELGLLLAAGALFGLGAGLVARPVWIVAMAGGGFLALFLGAGWLAWGHRVWIPWMSIAAVQWPAILLWLAWRRYLSIRAGAITTTVSGTPTVMDSRNRIPDHELIRCIGEGAYGEVWLARNEVGIFHAAKIVHRNRFSKDAPYEREFQGIQQFMPISRTHPGFVHILHVGRNRSQGFFYCVMEAGDDQTAGAQIHPDAYHPRTLASDLEHRGALPVPACVRLGLTLAHALDHLHKHQLIHRDIKPSNIIYVGGQPKFADIGLVTRLATDDHAVSMLGTEGYMAPEGPGTAGADVYSLGKVLYEAATGRDRRAFPELPTAVLEQDEPDPAMDRLTSILMTACDTDVTKRYLSAAALHADLLQLQRQLEKP